MRRRWIVETGPDRFDSGVGGEPSVESGCLVFRDGRGDIVEVRAAGTWLSAVPDQDGGADQSSAKLVDRLLELDHDDAYHHQHDLSTPSRAYGAAIDRAVKIVKGELRDWTDHGEPG